MEKYSEILDPGCGVERNAMVYSGVIWLTSDCLNNNCEAAFISWVAAEWGGARRTCRQHFIFAGRAADIGNPQYSSPCLFKSNKLRAVFMSSGTSIYYKIFYWRCLFKWQCQGEVNSLSSEFVTLACKVTQDNIFFLRYGEIIEELPKHNYRYHYPGVVPKQLKFKI